MKSLRHHNQPALILFLHLSLILLCCLCFLSNVLAQDLTPEEISQLKAKIRERLDDLNYYHTVASFVNLNLYPDISSSKYDIDNVGGSSISMIKLPITYDLGPEGWEWKPFIEGNLSYMKAYSSYDNLESLLGRFDTGENPNNLDDTEADMEWTGYSALIGIGVKIPITQTWSFSPSMDLAWSRFENDTEFSGPGGADYQELLDGLATNWTLDTLTYVGSLRFDYEKELDEIVLHLIGKYSHMYTDFRHDDDILNDFNVSNDILTGQIDLRGPLGYSFKDNDLGWDLFLAYHHFTGEVGSLVGAVDYYNEIGVFIRTDFAREVLYTNSLKLGTSYVHGDDIEGYTFRLSFGF
jgi:hypothetical protein